MTRNYVLPEFELVQTENSNKVFFAASGTPSFGGSIKSMGTTLGQW